MSQTTPGGSPAGADQKSMLAAGFAAVSLILFLLAIAGVWDVTLAYVVSIVAGLLAVGTAMQARRRGGAGAVATTALVVGGVLVLLQLAWIVLALLGVIEDTT